MSQGPDERQEGFPEDGVPRFEAEIFQNDFAEGTNRCWAQQAFRSHPT